MKPIYKILIFIVAAIFVSEFVSWLGKSNLMKPITNKLDSANKSTIDSYAKFGAKPVIKSLTELNNLFIENQHLRFDKTLTFKSRNPVSKFNYQNRYNIQVYKLDTLSKISFEKTVSEKSANIALRDNNFFAIVYVNHSVYYYNNAKAKNVRNILITLDGEDTRQIMLSDSIAYYYSNLNSMSVNYNDGIQDMVVKSNKTPSELLILKKNRNVYIFVLESNNYSEPLDSNLLLSLLVK